MTNPQSLPPTEEASTISLQGSRIQDAAHQLRCYWIYLRDDGRDASTDRKARFIADNDPVFRLTHVLRWTRNCQCPSFGRVSIRLGHCA